MDDKKVKKVRSEDDKKKITFLVVAIMIIVITATSSTYAFLALTANNASAVSGTIASANLSMTVTRKYPTSANYTASSGVMVPQLSVNSSNTNVLNQAIAGSSSKNCIDGNNNIVCQVYDIVITNSSTAAVSINTTFGLTADTMTNLKWYLLAEGDGTTPTTTYTYPTNLSGTTKYGNLKSVTSLDTNQTIQPSSSYYYVVVVWIEETGSNQTSQDSGSFTGLVTATSSDGIGVTSTIRG